MNQDCRMRRAEWASNILTRFSVHSLAKLAFQDEKGFTVQVKTNKQNNLVYGY